MRKIFNWVFGSFFRTFGRVLLYLLIGFLFAIIVSKSDIKIEDLFLMKVSAAVYDDINTGEMKVLDSEYSYNSNTPNDGTNFTVTINFNHNIDTSSGFLANSNYVLIPSSINIQAVQLNDPTNKISSVDNATMQVYINESSGVGHYCVIDSRNILCPISKDKTYSSLKIVIRTGAFSGGLAVSINVQRYFNFFNANTLDDVVSATNDLNNSINNVNDNINKTNDLITDDSAPDTESSIDSWSQKLANNPLEAVVMLPLTILNSIKTALSGTCSPLNLTLPFINYKVQIPCISSILGQIEGASALWNSIGSIVSALMLYKYLIYLYNWIDDTISLKDKRMRGWGSV